MTCVASYSMYNEVIGLPFLEGSLQCHAELYVWVWMWLGVCGVYSTRGGCQRWVRAGAVER